ncbi:MAG: tail fiber domain-containing protein [Candidatus Gracilibacteria bacterium]|nr:tail fiber domain-containing protein [Candidatus Gracilibacteria bacterium]
MKPFKNTTLYSRLALITSVTLVVGYFVVYAAWSSLTVGEVGPGATITTELMTKIKDNFEDLNTRVSNFSFSAGNVGIGTVSPKHALQVNGTVQVGDLTSPALLYGVSDIFQVGMNQSNYNAGTAQVWSEYLTNATARTFAVRSRSAGDTGTAGTHLFVNGATGNVGIGTTSPNSKLDIRGIGVNGGGIATGLVIAHVGSMGGDGAGIEFTYGNAGVGGSANIARIMPYTQPGGGGDLLFQTAPSNVGAYATKMKVQRDGNAWIAGTLTQASDLRLKKNIRSIDSGISTIDKLRGVTYNWKDETKNKDLQYGFVAQEMEKILPDLVKTDDKGYKSVNYTGIIPILVKSIQEQQLQTEELKSEILELRKENNNLKILMRLVEEKIENLESK